MASAANVVVLVGSLRKESLNRKIANALIALNAAPLKFEFALGHLPLYNQDLDGENPPSPWVTFRQQI
ncbi:MAG: phosphodiesterase [Candidatus Acidoferrum typicum]|nr:phosphodiesterase [Candidatus Acidoferrum typicum]